MTLRGSKEDVEKCAVYLKKLYTELVRSLMKCTALHNVVAADHDCSSIITRVTQASWGERKRCDHDVENNLIRDNIIQ